MGRARRAAVQSRPRTAEAGDGQPLNGLAEHLIASHLATEGAGPRLDSGEGRIAGISVDHVLVDGPEGVLAMRAFESTGIGRVATELALVCAERNALCGFENAWEQRDLERAALRCGAVFSRSGHGLGMHVYCARLASPGRVVLGTQATVTAAGALGALALAASEVEVAAVLAGASHQLAVPGVFGVALVGRPAAWLSGQDVVLELMRRLARGRAAGKVLEVVAPGARGMAASERLTLARQARELGALTVLIPSDDETRRFLRSQGREADWKTMSGDPEATYEDIVELDLAALEPLVARGDDGDVVPVSEIKGGALGGVTIGPWAGVADLARIARRLRGHVVHAGVDMRVVVGGRQIFETAARMGVLSELRRAGVRILHETDAGTSIPRPGQAATIAFGVQPAEVRGVRAFEIAGPDVCVASAIAGVVADPRALEGGASTLSPALEGTDDEAFVLDDALLIRSTSPAVREPTTGLGAGYVPLGAPIRGPLRGAVLLKTGDRVTVDQVLPWGAKVRPWHADVRGLAEYAFAGLDPAFAARAVGDGTGFVVSGVAFGTGARRSQAAMVVTQLGIRAVLARSFAPSFRKQLVLHGVLPLRFATLGDYDHVCQGDELEIPDLPEGLEPHKPLVVRNLTRGTQYTVRHELASRELVTVRAGGLLRALVPAAGGAAA